MGELEASNNSSDSSSHSSSGTRQLESPLPPQLSLELDKPGEVPPWALLLLLRLQLLLLLLWQLQLLLLL